MSEQRLYSHAGAICTAYNSTVGGIWSARAGRPGWWRESGRGEAGEQRAVKASKRRRRRPRQRRRRPSAASRLSPHAAGVATARRGAAWPNFARPSGVKPSCRRVCVCRGRGVPSPKASLGQSQGSAGRLRRSSRASRRPVECRARPSSASIVNNKLKNSPAKHTGSTQVKEVYKKTPSHNTGGGVPSSLGLSVFFLSFFAVLPSLPWVSFFFTLGTGLARTGTNTGTPS